MGLNEVTFPRNEERHQAMRYPFHPRRDEYLEYEASCDYYECEPLTIEMWAIHGYPTGPI